MKKNLKFIIIFAVFAIVCGSWYLIWNRVGDSLDMARYESEISRFDADGAHYLRLDTDGLHAYLPDVDSVTAALCGEPLGTQALSISVGTVAAKAYTLEDYAYTGDHVPVRVLEISGRYYAYELAGFLSLDDAPSVDAVCSAYGIRSAEDIAEITETDAESKDVRHITDAAALSAYYQKILALGKPLTAGESAQKYYDAYTAEYGTTEQLVLENDEVQALDDETYQKAMTLWGKGMYTADISLKNGLKLRGCICAPKPGIFSFYANYAMPMEEET